MAKVDARQFRSFFSHREKDFLVYTPDEKFSVSHFNSPEEFFASFQKQTKAMTATHLYRPDGPGGEASGSSLSQETPITFVFFPGFMSEFIETKTFDEIFSQKKKSAFQKEMGHTLMEDFHFASLDAKGTPLFRALLFKTPPLSFKTSGDIRENAQDFIQRLERFFSAYKKVPENLVFAGYSRGAMVALEVLALAKQRELSWLKNVKGLVSLGGVLFGTEISDEIFNPRSSSYKELKLLKKLRNELKPTQNLQNEISDRSELKRFLWEWLRRKRKISPEDQAIIKNNTKAWINFVRSIGQLPVDWSLLSMLLSGFKKGEETNHKETLSLLLKLLGKEFGLKNFITGYSQNILRFQKFVDELVVGVEQMSTESRLKWWRENTLPDQGIRYYAIAACFADPAMDIKLAQHRAEHHPKLPKLLDYKFSLRNFRHLKKISGTALNDSQVCISKAVFWPKLIEHLNPKQAALDTCLLGILGTHHWGLAIPIVIQMKDRSKDPFPRVPLLKALAASVALDLR